jgi:hypothetical protein
MKLSVATQCRPSRTRSGIADMTTQAASCLLPLATAGESPVQMQHTSWMQALQRLSLTSVWAAASRVGYTPRRSPVQLGKPDRVQDRFPRCVQGMAP